MRLKLIVSALAVAVVLAGCGVSSTPPAAAGPAPLTIDKRVVPGDLAGLTSVAGTKLAPTSEELVLLLNPDSPDDPDVATERDQERARFASVTYVAGALKAYGDGMNQWGGSAVVQLATPDQAVALEKRLYEEEFSTDLPPDAVKATVAGASNSHTITAQGTQDGVTYTTGVTSFADGPFLYVVFAGGAGGAVDPQAVLSAGMTLLGAVKGHPAA